MKKLITLLFFALFLAIGTQSSQAQERPEEVAKAQVSALSEPLNLSGEQQRTLFRIFVKKEAAYAKSIKGKDLNNPAVAQQKEEIDVKYMEGVKETLTSEQYQKFLEMEQ